MGLGPLWRGRVTAPRRSIASSSGAPGTCARRRRAARPRGARSRRVGRKRRPGADGCPSAVEEALTSLDPGSTMRPRVLARLAIEVYYVRPRGPEGLSAEGAGGRAQARRPALLEALGASTWRCGAPPTRGAPGHRRRAHRCRAPRRRPRGGAQGVKWRVADWWSSATSTPRATPSPSTSAGDRPAAARLRLVCPDVASDARSSWRGPG